VVGFREYINVRVDFIVASNLLTTWVIMSFAR